MSSGKTEEIPTNLELLSDDNRVGVLLAAGCLILGVGLSGLLGWGGFFQVGGMVAALLGPLLTVIGGVVLLLCIQRLLVPGCRPLLRVNFGGVTDIRLVTAPIRWAFIAQARRPRGIWFYLLPGVILEMDPEYHPSALETPWSRLLHLPCRLRGRNILFLECGTLDMSAEQTLTSIRSHLRERHPASRR